MESLLIFLEIFSGSSISRHSALADLCRATMDAGVFENHCGSFRTLLLSLPRNDSNICNELYESHLFSAPYSKMGRILVSTLTCQTGVISLLERGPYSHKQRKISLPL